MEKGKNNSEYQIFDCTIKIPSEAVEEGKQNEFIINQLRKIEEQLNSKSNEKKFGINDGQNVEWSVHETIESIAAREEAELNFLPFAVKENKLLSQLNALLSDKRYNNEFGLSSLESLKGKIKKNEPLAASETLLCSVYKNGAFGNKENIKENGIFYTIDKYANLPLDSNDPKKCIESRALNFVNVLKKTGMEQPERYLRSYLLDIPNSRKYIDLKATENKVMLAANLVPEKAAGQKTADANLSTGERQNTEIANSENLDLSELQIHLRVPEDVLASGKSVDFVLGSLNKVKESVELKKNIMEVLRDENGRAVGYWKDPAACMETSMAAEKKRNISPDDQEKELLSALKTVLKDRKFAETESYNIVKKIKTKMDFEETLTSSEKLIYDSVMSLEAMSQNFHNRISEKAVQKAAAIPVNSKEPNEINRELYKRCYKLVDIINKDPPTVAGTVASIKKVSEVFCAYIPSDIRKKCNVQQREFTGKIMELFGKMQDKSASFPEREKNKKPAEKAPQREL